MRAHLFGGAVVALAGLFACTSSSSLGDASPPSTSDAPPGTCPVSLDAGPYFPRHDALPSGSCTSDAIDCTLEVLDCACANAQGPIDVYACTCSSGTWECSIRSRGTALCDYPSCDCLPGDEQCPASDAPASDATGD